MEVDQDHEKEEDFDGGSIEIDPYGADAMLEICDIAGDGTVKSLTETEMRPFDRAKIIGYDFGNDDCWWTETRTGLIHREDCEEMYGYCERFFGEIEDVEESDFCPDCFQRLETRIDEDGWW